MAFYYFDAGALVKYYVTEPGSTWVRQVIDAQDPVSGQAHHIILVAEITRVEVAAGLTVIERIGRIRKAKGDRAYRRFMSQLAHRYAMMPLTPSIISLPAIFLEAVGDHTAEARDHLSGQLRPAAPHLYSFSIQGY
jgi:uncharacterized protein